MEKHTTKLINKQSTDFVAHNMLMNYILWDDNQLLLESFVKNCNLDLNFNVDNFHFCITGIDSKYNNYTESETFEMDIEKALNNYQEIYQVLTDYHYFGNCLLIKVDNSKKTAIIFSALTDPLCSPYAIAEKINSIIMKKFQRKQKYITTSLVCNYHGYESIHLAYEEAQKLNQFAFFGIREAVITSEIIERMRIDCTFACIDENCRKLKYLCCNESLDEILHQVDVIFNQLVRYSLNHDYFSTAYTLCETILPLFQKIYQIDDLLLARRQRDYDNLKDYVEYLNKRLTHIYNVCKNQVRYSHNVLLAMSFMMNNYKLDIFLTTISQFINVNPTSLSSDFNREVKMSISEYISKLRINEAKALLKSTMSIDEIVSSVGFTNVRYFSNIFKKEMNMTPLTYRKLINKRT